MERLETLKLYVESYFKLEVRSKTLQELRLSIGFLKVFNIDFFGLGGSLMIEPRIIATNRQRYIWILLFGAGSSSVVQFKALDSQSF